MDFELSRVIEDNAAKEAEINRLRAIIDALNGVTNHQTNRPRREGFAGLPFEGHPLTCGNDSNHTPLYPFFNGKKVVLVCRDCDYTQDNAAMYSTDMPTLRPLDFDDRDVGC